MTAYEPQPTTGPVASGSLAAPATPDGERDAAELRAELSRLRNEVAASVEELAIG